MQQQCKSCMMSKIRLTLFLLASMNVSSSFSLLFVPSSPTTLSRRPSIHTTWRMVSTDDITFSANDKFTIPTTTSASSSLSAAAYPTARGSEVDSRKIIATGAGRKYLTAVRLAHILLLSDDMAQDCLHQLRSATISFEDLARQISHCAETRHLGGELGWISTTISSTSTTTSDEDDAVVDNKDQHLDAVFPQQAREHVVQITTKPGDVVVVQSTRGYHLVQVLDVMADVQKMATFRRAKRSRATTGFNSNQHQDDQQLFLQGKTYKMETMGCQMNQADSERMAGQLQSLGLRPVEGEEDPHVIIFNTCSIRDHAEQKVYSYVGPYAKRKRQGEDVTIVVAGCVAQQEGQALLRRVPEIDLVMGPQYANRMGDLLEDVVIHGNQVVAREATHIMEDSTKPRRQSTVAAWVNVIYGCNERCTFCIVPSTRGVEQSRPVESIVKEVQDLVSQGYQEVTLLGQNIDAYGRDMLPKRKFSDLIRTVGAVPGLKRLRFVTSHPRYMSMGVIDAVAETPTACESFHIPFQSGSNRILATMGRGHTREKYLHIIDRIRSRIPDAAITADVIVGFPGETDEDFEDSLSLMETVVFDSVNTAAYSPRPNTPAAEWENQVPDHIKQERLQRINEVNKRHAMLRRARLLGRTVEILVEERNVKVPNQVMGRTRHGYIVYCDGDIDELKGKVVSVLIENCQMYHLMGANVGIHAN